MPDALVVAVPDGGGVGWVGGDGRVAVEQVEDSIGSVGEGGDVDPIAPGAGGGVIGFAFKCQRDRTAGIGGEKDIEAAGAGDIAAASCAGQIGIGAGDQHGEVGLVGIGNPGVIDGDGPPEGVAVRPG